MEENYILRLCPCGRRRQDQRVCDCDYGSGKTHCSGLLKVAKDPSLKVYPYCVNTEETAKSDDFLDLDSPGTTCESVMLGGTLHSCTPIQEYDKVRIKLHKIDLAKLMAERGVGSKSDFKCIDSDLQANAIEKTIEQKMIDAGDGKGEFSIWARNLRGNSTFCIQVELVDHPYCNIHHTVGHVVHQPVVCVNNMAQPVILPDCEVVANVETSITSDSDAFKQKVMWGVLTCLVFALVLAIGFGVVYCKRQKTLRLRYINAKRADDLMMDDSPILKNKGFATTLFSHHLLCQPPGDVFFLHFPETKEFEQANEILREYMSSFGCRVSDLSDPQHDERISEDPEGWVMSVMNRHDVRIVVLDSPLARMSLAVASSSTASTSLVSSSASVECRSSTGCGSSTSGGVSNGHDPADEDLEEEEEARIPLSLAASRSGPPLPESAVEDNHHELRVFALRQIQSRFSGKYNQLVVVRFDGFATTTTVAHNHNNLLNHQHHQQQATVALESVAQTLTPHMECLVLPQHLPEFRLVS